MQWCLNEYDPRFRPWYATAASGPKDVVIVVDSSGSMSSGDRIKMAKDAAAKVIDTLSANDYVNVIDFASSAKAYSSNGLVKADETVTKEDSAMKAWVKNIRASGSTKYLPLGWRVGVILPALKCRMDVSVVPDVVAPPRAAAAPPRRERRSALSIVALRCRSAAKIEANRR